MEENIEKICDGRKWKGKIIHMKMEKRNLKDSLEIRNKKRKGTWEKLSSDFIN